MNFLMQSIFILLNTINCSFPYYELGTQVTIQTISDEENNKSEKYSEI